MPDTETPWDLVKVNIGGIMIDARPIKWDGNPIDNEGRMATGIMVRPLLYMTTCPHCGQLIEFKANHKTAKCPSCGKGETFIEPILDEQAFEPFLEWVDIDLSIYRKDVA
jgi:endogenous inhibitor of DNA gyrase (YacG/DUF329 family)